MDIPQVTFGRTSGFVAFNKEVSMPLLSRIQVHKNGRLYSIEDIEELCKMIINRKDSDHLDITHIPDKMLKGDGASANPDARLNKKQF
jgi:hypothetical protein